MSANLAETMPRLLPLAVEGLGYEVRGARLIDAIDLRLEDPGVTVVMGPNGAGAGRLRWNGAVVDQAVRSRQALVFQRPVLLRRSVRANVEFVLRLRPGERHQTAMHWLEHVGLADVAERPARRLSGGEQQRLAMARSLALEPEVLLMDEPTASLDPASVATIESLVDEARQLGTKVVFVTHDIGQARRLADDVVFLHRGRLMEHTAAATFFNEPASSAARDYLAGRLVL
ncbi:MAG: ATP-binding cassette domain-containing protein [Gammaproteobacteria bacterium]|nr:ATP-binding cassette domain-containing protein [Gammaproteobacteria bacterium]